MTTAIDRSTRETSIATFLTVNGWGTAKRALLAGDASFRRYDRLTGDVEALLGRPATSVREFVAQRRDLFPPGGRPDEG